ncbi:MAG: hypothetical protein C5S49_04535 [Candidatus Methanogaster sp.]|nr:MAG: hypothetical protein C5S49_04535 [ANME-2 cluster archaeon]
MAKKFTHRNQVCGNRDTVDTRRIRVEQMRSSDQHYLAKCYGDLNSISHIGSTHHISRMEFWITGGILMVVAFGMGGDDGSIARIADDPTTGHPVIKSLTHTGHDIGTSITTNSILPNIKPDCSANYNLVRSGAWGCNIVRCRIKSLSSGS